MKITVNLQTPVRMKKAKMIIKFRIKTKIINFLLIN